MKHLPILLFFTFALIACSKSEPNLVEPERPGETPPEPPAQPAAISFADGNTTEISAGTADGSLHIILYRDVTPSAPSQTCALVVTEGSDFAWISPEAVFEDGSATAEASLGFSPSKMRQKRRSVTVALPEYGCSLTILFKKDDTPMTDAGTYTMFADGVFSQIKARNRVSGNTSSWILEKEDFIRQFNVSDGHVSVVATGGAAPSESYGHAEIWPGVMAPSFCSDKGIGLNVCSVAEGRAEFPHSEYYLPPLPPGARYACATICDGWLLPVVAIEGALLSPDEHRWTAPARIDADGTVTVFGPYHNTSPLQRINAAPLESSWRITTEDNTAVLPGQFSGFTNSDVFAFAFTIGANGSLEQRGPDLKIVFDTPMHNCTADGQAAAAVDRVWGTVRPVVIELQQSSISAM